MGTIAAGVAKGPRRCHPCLRRQRRHRRQPVEQHQEPGLPFGIGLAETHQVLLANGLPPRVTVRADGGLATSRDVVAGDHAGRRRGELRHECDDRRGCIMARVCHKNTCPVGVATQDPELHARNSRHAGGCHPLHGGRRRGCAGSGLGTSGRGRGPDIRIRRLHQTRREFLDLADWSTAQAQCPGRSLASGHKLQRTDRTRGAALRTSTACRCSALRWRCPGA